MADRPAGTHLTLRRQTFPGRNPNPSKRTLFRLRPAGQQRLGDLLGFAPPDLQDIRLRRWRRPMFLRLAPFFCALALRPFALFAPAPTPTSPILLVVPPGSELAVVERARSAVPLSRKFLLVGESERVPLKGGLEILVDRTFADAPATDVLVLLPGETGRAAEDFFLGRRGSARAILLPGGSPIVKRLKEEGSRGALILVGGVESIPALLGAVSPTTSGEAPAGVTRRPATTSPPPAPTATPAPSGNVFDRYFSSSGPSVPSPSPTPR